MKLWRRLSIPLSYGKALVAEVQQVADKTRQMVEAECRVVYRSLGLAKGRRRAKMAAVRVDALRWGFPMVMPLTIFDVLKCLYRCMLWDVFLAVMHVRLGTSHTDDTRLYLPQ
jgi:hypothetical protein